MVSATHRHLSDLMDLHQMFMDRLQVPAFALSVDS